MIASLRGKVEYLEPGRVIIETGGVGYEVFVPLSTYHKLPKVGEVTRLEIRQVVREDSVTLYGFSTLGEKRAFELLMQVQQVGPKLALAILSTFSAEELASAIGREDVGLLDAVPGVGTKVAERIVRELRDKTDVLRALVPGPAPREDRTASLVEDAISALVNLGYKQHEARRAVEKVVSRTANSTIDLENLIRQSLAILLSEK